MCALGDVSFEVFGVGGKRVRMYYLCVTFSLLSIALKVSSMYPFSTIDKVSVSGIIHHLG